MSENIEGVKSGPEGSGAGIDPTAVALALAGASREKADAFLDKQNTLIDDQRYHLHEQLRQIHLDVWEKRLGVLLRIGTAIVGVAVAGALGFMVWQASQSAGLRIQPFSVPSDLASRGITGDVVAGRVLDQLNRMQAATISRRASRTYASDWSQQGIKLEVPETGVSLTEVDRFLRDRLGNDIQVSGDVISTPAGLTLTVRADRGGDASVSGPESALPELVRQAAEAIYRFTQPYRYSVYVRALRPDEALALSKSTALSGLPEDRPWAYNAWALQMQVREGADSALDLFERGAARQPGNPLIRANIGEIRRVKGQWELSLALVRDAIPLVNNNERLLRPDSLEPMRLGYVGRVNRLLGAFHQATIEATQVIESGDPGQVSPLADLMMSQLGAHEWSAAHEVFAHPASTATNSFFRELNNFNIAWAQIEAASVAENWRAVLEGQRPVEAQVLKSPGLRSQLPTTIVPLQALAKAHLGRVAEADRDIAPTPGDCDPCLIARAQLLELQGQHVRADYWFGRAVANAPSIPFANHEWGRALLARHLPDTAIENFVLANKKGPHFADPLEGWGEALMAKNQSHLALAKFAEAEKYAPNWGGLHLRWGEALVYAGKKDEAKKQFARAAQLDLTAADKAELARVAR